MGVQGKDLVAHFLGAGMDQERATAAATPRLNAYRGKEVIQASAKPRALQKESQIGTRDRNL